MGLGKQAKTLSSNQQKAVLNYLASTRSPVRNKVIFLLSLKAGLRAKEISQLKWRMVTTSEGNIADCISLTNTAPKGSSGGVIWLNTADCQICINWYIFYILVEITTQSGHLRTNEIRALMR